MSKYIRGFHWSSRAWYAKANKLILPEVTFGMYEENGEDCCAEMVMRWHDLGNTITPRLECFEDAWSVLNSFNDLILALSMYTGKNISDETFVSILKMHNFKDLTKYTMESKEAI
jgi:hypothetical protein